MLGFGLCALVLYSQLSLATLQHFLSARCQLALSLSEDSRGTTPSVLQDTLDFLLPFALKAPEERLRYRVPGLSRHGG